MRDLRTVTLPWPDPALRSNTRAPWQKKHRLTKKARADARTIAQMVAKLPCWPTARIYVEYYPKAYREDIHNVPASLKAYLDGIADAMGCDDRGFAVDYPSEWAGKDLQGRVVFRIEEGAKL